MWTQKEGRLQMNSHSSTNLHIRLLLTIHNAVLDLFNILVWTCLLVGATLVLQILSLRPIGYCYSSRLRYCKASSCVYRVQAHRKQQEMLKEFLIAKEKQ